MKTSRVIALVILLLSSASAIAEKSEDGWVYGPGTASCGKWTKENGSELGYMYMGWVLGFVTAADIFKDLDLTDAAGMKAFIDNYCRQHPTDPLSRATAHLVVHLAD